MAFKSKAYNARLRGISFSWGCAALYIILFSLYLNLLKANALKRIELTQLNACTNGCQCQAGEYANDVIVCDGGDYGSSMEIDVLSLPSFVNAVKLSNASLATFRRGSIRVTEGKTFSISLNNVKRSQMDEKSLTLASGSSRLKVEIRKTEELQLKQRFVSARSGTVELMIDHAESISIEAQAFDILDKINLKNVGSLHLEQLSFKPNVPPLLQQPEFIAEFTNISNIASIPSDSFPSAARIEFTNCNISDLETNAFSGNQMTNLTFNNTSIDRLHTHAFPGKSLIAKLEFITSDLSSVSPKAVASAITLLDIKYSQITSISQEAFNCPHVAKVILYKNVFSTISTQTFVFESWSNLIIDSNQFKFVESGAFSKISASNPNVKFTFKGNHIHYANQNALTLQLLPINVTYDITDNVFHKECECEYQEWLDRVCSAGSFSNPLTLDFAEIIKNTSLCAVPSFALDCFENEKYVPIHTYSKLSCGNDYNDNYVDAACMKSISTVWDDFQDQIEVTTNKGILLIVLLFVLASSFVVGILTLFRWIVYSFQMRGKYPDNDEEWNFTKVEERLIPCGSDDEMNNSPSSFNGSLIQHYESLPLTTTEVLLESTPSSTPTKTKGSETGRNEGTMNQESQSHTSSHKSPSHNRVTDAERKHNPDLTEELLQESSPTPNWRTIEIEIEKEKESPVSKTLAPNNVSPNTMPNDVSAETINSTNSTLPKQSFFDEMINLLTEKLDDPGNYGTVLDTKNNSSEATQQTLYQDPVSLQTDG